MAEITRTNGNVKAQGNGGTSGAIGADELVIANGADLDFFKIIQQIILLIILKKTSKYLLNSLHL